MKYYILADCNNFYVSCEKLFNPRLEGKAVAVLSQNDGCIISRSQEAKQLGLRMGEPYYKVKEQCLVNNVVVLSSNYRFYGDISARVMQILTKLAEEIEIYSIDEAFMKFSNTLTPEAIIQEALKMRETVRKWVGIPISIGIAPTKTLAKVANSLAKKMRNGVYSVLCPVMREKLLKEYPIEEVWGIGSQLSLRLRSRGVFTVSDFINMDSGAVRKCMGVVGERMFLELKGIAALDLVEEAPRKNITFTRSFGQLVTTFTELAEALSTFAGKACVKLRLQKSCASALQIYVETVSDKTRYSHFGMTWPFSQPTNDTSQVITAAKNCLQKLFVPHETYRKCGIFLLDLIPEEHIVPDLFLGDIDPKRRSLMQAVDTINAHFGKNSIFFGAMGVQQRWASRSEHRTKYNTTSWEQLPVVYT